MDNRSDELTHYGVLGMKWGMHRARKQGIDYTYRSYGQRRTEKKLNRLQNKYQGQKLTVQQNRKLQNTKSNLKMFKARDKARQKFAESTTVGKTIIRGILLNPIGAGEYNRKRAMGYGPVASAFSTPLSLFRSKGEENRMARMSTRERE